MIMRSLPYRSVDLTMMPISEQAKAAHDMFLQAIDAIKTARSEGRISDALAVIRVQHLQERYDKLIDPARQVMAAKVMIEACHRSGR